MAVMSETGNAYRNLGGATCSKGEVLPVYAIKVCGALQLYLYSFLTSALVGAECSALLPVRFIPDGKSFQYSIECSVGGGGVVRRAAQPVWTLEKRKICWNTEKRVREVDFRKPNCENWRWIGVGSESYPIAVSEPQVLLP
jgi:hypothetical protein